MDRRFQIVALSRPPSRHRPGPRSAGLPLGIGLGHDRDPGCRAHGPGRPARELPRLHPWPRPPRPAAGAGVLVQNPQANKVKVSYVIDGVSYELKPGESRTHAITAKSQIRYNRGGTQGNVVYQLSAGTYRFAIQ